MPRYDVLRRWCMRTQCVKRIEHFADVECRGERPADFHVLVEMRHVGRQHDDAPLCVHLDELQADRVPAGGHDGNPRRHLARPGAIHHPPVEIQPHHAAHIIGLEAPGELLVLHVVAHGVVHLRFLQMEPHMRENHVLDLGGIDADQRQRIDRIAREPAAAACRRSPR
jgi:hypothetical protein